MHVAVGKVRNLLQFLPRGFRGYDIPRGIVIRPFDYFKQNRFFEISITIDGKRELKREKRRGQIVLQSLFNIASTYSEIINLILSTIP